MAGDVVAKDELKRWPHNRYSVEFSPTPFAGFRPIWCVAVPATG
jgi:hypothetical protein